MAIENIVKEGKKYFIEEAILPAIKYAYAFAGKVTKISYIFDEEEITETAAVEIEKKTGEVHRIDIDITADSPSAMLADIVKTLNHLLW